MEDITKSEKLLGLILLQLMGESSQKEKIVALNQGGFSNLEIANLLEATTAVVSQSLYENKSKKKGSAKAKRDKE